MHLIPKAFGYTCGERVVSRILNKEGVQCETESFGGR
jgi:uncharacterized protein YjaZ